MVMVQNLPYTDYIVLITCLIWGIVQFTGSLKKNGTRVFLMEDEINIY